MRSPEAKLPLVCAVTMVKDDYFFLSKWMEYYGGQLGKENLFVIAHGSDPKACHLAAGANIIPLPPRANDTVGHSKFEVDRFALINGICNGLVRYYDHVIFVDVDEFLVVDPTLALTLPQYLSLHSEATTISAVGLDVVHRSQVEGKGLRVDVPVLSQRRFCKVEPLYCKPVITRVPITRSLGNHASNDSVLHFGPNLYLFHMKWVDRVLSMNMHKSRHLSKLNADVARGFDVDEVNMDFPGRSRVVEIFDGFNDLTVVDRGFDFSREKASYSGSWRRRRFLFQTGFWRSLLKGGRGTYSFHWRFDPLRYPELHQIPIRFQRVI